MPHEKKLVYLESQPRFPSEDVSEGNAEVIGLLLRENPGIIGQSRFLQAHQRVLHHIATRYPCAAAASVYRLTQKPTAVLR